MHEGGALDTLTLMQGALAKEEVQRECPRRRLNAVRTLEQSRRPVARELEPAATVTREEGTQYIATMNSDDLAKAERMGFDATPYVIESRLDDSETGGLFGFRF